MKQRRAVVGLDVGGTKIASGLFLEDGRNLRKKQVATVQESADASIAQLVALVEESIFDAPRDVTIAGVGIAVPGWVNLKGRTVWAPNIVGWDHIPLEARLAERLPLPMCIDSDRNAYVKGEAWQGEGRGVSDLVFLAVGSGIGAGIMADRRLIHGHDDLAGAVGWMALDPRYEDLYARMGCFEAEASGNSVARKAAQRLVKREAREDITARATVEAAEAGDREAQQLLDEVATYLGMGVANLISTLNPEMIVLGGGLFLSGDYLLARVRAEYPRWAQPFAAERVRVVRSALGDSAGLLGAARIALDNTLIGG